jgi:hypothetical protein
MTASVSNEANIMPTHPNQRTPGHRPRKKPWMAFVVIPGAAVRRSQGPMTELRLEL